MAYTVLARRYRSQTFDEVVGQEAIARTLSSAIEQNRVAHAYLFCGTRGVGKTTVARILARALNCEKGPTPKPCGKCDICLSIHRGDDMDVLEIDGASNNLVDDVRTLRDNAHYRPARARFKIYYIDEVHMLSKNAFNALLKTLEEPPEHVKFIFSTTEPERLPATILSRCQRFDFRAVPTEQIAEHLAAVCKAEKAKADKAALLAIAREGRGSIRDALTLLDQVLAVGGGKVTIEAVRETVGAAGGDAVLALLDAAARGEVGQALTRFAALLAAGIDLQALLDQMMRQVRDLLVAKTCGDEAELLDAFGPDRKALDETAARLSVPALVGGLGYLAEARDRVRHVVDGRPVAELAIVRLASLAELEPLSQVLAHLEALEQSLGGAAPAAASGRAPAGQPPPRSAATQTPPRTAARPTAAAPAPASDEKKNAPAHMTTRAADEAASPPRAAAGAAARPARRDASPQPTPAEELAAATGKRQRMEKALSDPLVKKALEIFDGRLLDAEG
jgi:DNA polymerase-3 subunit gamma/tau